MITFTFLLMRTDCHCLHVVHPPKTEQQSIFAASSAKSRTGSNVSHIRSPLENWYDYNISVHFPRCRCQRYEVSFQFQIYANLLALPILIANENVPYGVIISTLPYLVEMPSLAECLLPRIRVKRIDTQNKMADCPQSWYWRIEHEGQSIRCPITDIGKIIRQIFGATYLMIWKKHQFSRRHCRNAWALISSHSRGCYEHIAARRSGSTRNPASHQHGGGGHSSSQGWCELRYLLFHLHYKSIVKEWNEIKFLASVQTSAQMPPLTAVQQCKIRISHRLRSKGKPIAYGVGAWTSNWLYYSLFFIIHGDDSDGIRKNLVKYCSSSNIVYVLHSAFIKPHATCSRTRMR